MNRGRINQGIVIVLIGLFFLLRNLGWVNESVFIALWDNWPVLLIFLGIYIMLSRSKLWFIPALLSITLFLVVVGFWVPLPTVWHDKAQSPFDFAIPTDIETLDIVFDAPAAQLLVQRGAAGSVSGRVDFVGIAPDSSARRLGDRFEVSFSHTLARRWSLNRWQAPDWRVNIPASVPTSLRVQAAAGDITLDMRGIDVRNLDVETSAARVQIVFDQSVVEAVVNVRTAAASVQLTVPEGIGLRVRSTGAIVANNLDELGFERRGDWYISPDYEQAERRVEVHATSAVGNLHVNRRLAL